MDNRHEGGRVRFRRQAGMTDKERIKELEERLRLAELDGAYWRGRAEALAEQKRAEQKPKSGITAEQVTGFLEKLKQAPKPIHGDEILPDVQIIPKRDPE